MSSLQTIQSAIITAYQAITLPNSLGAPTGYKHEPKGGFGASQLPAVVVTRSMQTTAQSLSSEDRLVTRLFIVDLYTYPLVESDPVNATSRNNTADCIQTIETAFINIHGLNALGVLAHQITSDTSDVPLISRDNTRRYLGVRFRHEVTYWQL